jgi:hypothetical protein
LPMLRMHRLFPSCFVHDPTTWTFSFHLYGDSCWGICYLVSELPVMRLTPFSEVSYPCVSSE